MAGSWRMPRPRPAAACLALVALLVSGCASSTSDADAAAGDAGVTIDADRPDPSFGAVQTGPAVGPDLDATTEAAPRLVEGEWWRIRFASSFYDTEDVEFVRVVANATPEGYIFGMPHEGWYKEAIAYHAPAFGDVALNLSYHTHNEWFQPLRFPLTQGDTWTTTFATSVYEARVERADATTADVAFYAPSGNPSVQQQVLGLVQPPSSGPAMRLTYDARMHEVVKMESPVGTWEVVAHGYEFRGWVTVPRGEHTAIDYGTFGPAAPDQPVLTRTVDVGGGFNRMTMMHIVFATGPGTYRLTSTPPDGEPFVTELTGAPGFVVRFYEAMNPDGAWTQEDLNGGAGGTYSMGIAYHQYDIQVPGGARRADHAHEVIR
jgi:hypothetical protein